MLRIEQLGMECCGCAACSSACRIGCISMVADAEGFRYPEVDARRCVECRLCEHVCPVLNAQGRAPVKNAYAAKSLDESIRLSSSSGGIFSELCRPTFLAGGIVYGVAMDDDCRGCSFVAADDESSLGPIRGSKYLQAQTERVYEQIEADLQKGRKVLFAGTPCQANALAAFIGGNRENLCIVDCICHGVPSPKLWEANIDYLEHKHNAKVKSVSFRCKDIGWKRYGIKVETDNGSIFEPIDQSGYLRMFLRDYCLRPSCYDCASKTARSSDLTIADFWGVEDLMPEMADELGCSLVIIRTDAGANALEAIKDNLELREVDYKAAVRKNPSEYSSAEKPPERERFFDDLETLGYAELARKYGIPRAKERAKRFMRGALSRFAMFGKR